MWLKQTIALLVLPPIFHPTYKKKTTLLAVSQSTAGDCLGDFLLVHQIKFSIQQNNYNIIPHHHHYLSLEP